MNSCTQAPVFGPLLKGMRVQRRITLREFCRRANADPGNISRMERGVWPPPQDREILERYAKALDIKEASDDWYRFFDSAAADCGIVPQDIASDHGVVRMLPVIFRSLRAQRATLNETGVATTMPLRAERQTDKGKLVVSELRAALEGIYGRQLVELRLYGSRARGDSSDESDYDVLVVLDGVVDAMAERRRCSGAIYDVCWKHDVVVMCHFMSAERFKTEQSPYVLNVRREGVAV